MIIPLLPAIFDTWKDLIVTFILPETVFDKSISFNKFCDCLLDTDSLADSSKDSQKLYGEAKTTGLSQGEKEEGPEIYFLLKQS